jgi:transposase InsO family protein
MEIIRLVEGSDLPISRTLRQLEVPRSSFYRWYRAYQEHGYDGLTDTPAEKRIWNRIPDRERKKVVEVALSKPELSPRELAWYITDHANYFISESSVYRILKDFDLVASPHYIVMSAKDKFEDPTKRVNELWQTDFTYLKVVGWGWYYLLTILDDFSRYILGWRLFTGMASGDVKVLLDEVLETTGVENAAVRHRPRLLSDNGPCFVSGELSEYLESRSLKHTRGRPYHPMTQGKIERYHRTMKNVIKLQNHYLPGQLERELEDFVDVYNHHRVHESLDNLTPADIYFGRRREIQTAREKLKAQTLENRRRANRGQAVRSEEPIVPSIYRGEVSTMNRDALCHFS